MLRELLLTLVGLSTGLATHAQTGLKETKTYEEALKSHQQYRGMNALYLVSLGWARLARTKDPRALDILIEEFGNVRKPKQVMRNLLTQIATREFRNAESVDTYTAWRASNTKPKDAWLWYRTLSVECLHRGPATALAIALDSDVELALRAAAVEALGWGKDPSGAYAAIEAFAKAMPKKLEDKALVIGAMGTALEKHKRHVRKREFKVACSYFINLLSDEYELDVTTKLVVARALGRALRSEEIVINPEPWVALLGDKKRPQPKKPKIEYVRPTFAGVEAAGMRVCYLIDMSDSMSKDVDIPDSLRKGPVSGGDGKTKKDPIPWHLVKTRFDLAREQIKVSLRELDESALFSVVYFGDEAGLLDSSKGMVKATRGTIKKIIKELDAIKLDSPTATRPDGRLRGKTNLHSGLRTAFRVRKKGLLEDESYVNPEQFLQGCDTIFLLSDGNPSCDDYEMRDANVDEVNFGDPESGVKSEGGPNVIYNGPYRNMDLLLEDLERLNLFREVEIHCVALGRDVDLGFLRRIAELGHGKVIELGR